MAVFVKIGDVYFNPDHVVSVGLTAIDGQVVIRVSAPGTYNSHEYTLQAALPEVMKRLRRKVR